MDKYSIVSLVINYKNLKTLKSKNLIYIKSSFGTFYMEFSFSGKSYGRVTQRSEYSKWYLRKNIKQNKKVKKKEKKEKI